MLFRSRKNRSADTAVKERRPESIEAENLVAEGRYFEAIDTLNAANRESRDPQIERELRDLRHLAGINLLGLGIIGSYVWRAYENTKARPLAVVMQAQQFAGSAASGGGLPAVVGAGSSADLAPPLAS